MTDENQGGAPGSEGASPSGVQRPPHRRLRVYAFDPSLARRLDTAMINSVVLCVPWEHDPRTGRSSLEPGPVGEYLEVVDIDPASDRFYPPVDLNDPHLLAQDGLAPSEDHPQFHQQMVYAVAMNTIGFFEEALGRVAIWSGREEFTDDGGFELKFVRRLRVYPHALREANAYYSPDKKALLFGYFTASSHSTIHAPGNIVFTCLSHDIIAHEVSHALLDGVHPLFAEVSNPDVFAFHEAFSDLVAIFQHFSHREVLRDQIAKTGGDLARQNLLGELAQEFGRGLGHGGALRDALGEIDATSGEWRPREPDPTRLGRTSEPHARGSILVAAVFEAFVAIYTNRVSDLVRIAGDGGSERRLAPELVDRMADEAVKSAHHVLRMCIRAIDYCQPVDITFGDYLRALITADSDLFEDDPHHYRIALVEAFRRHGIYPRGVRSLSVDSLRWRPFFRLEGVDETELRRELDRLFDPRAEGDAEWSLAWDLSTDREEAWRGMREGAKIVRHRLRELAGPATARALGLVLGRTKLRTIVTGEDGLPEVEVHGVRTARRSGFRGQLTTELVLSITQSRRGYLDPEKQKRADAGRKVGPEDFTYRAGCTVILDPKARRVRYAIVTHGDIADGDRLERQRRFIHGDEGSLASLYYGASSSRRGEPFAALHRSCGG